MDPKRQGEIALLLLKHQYRQQGINVSQNFPRELGNVAKAIGIPTEELMQFTRLLLQEHLDECFAACFAKKQ